jgi:hypothetical protein
MLALPSFAPPVEEDALRRVAPAPLVGLAALTRMAMQGKNLGAVARKLLARLETEETDAAALLDLSTIEQLLGASENRRALQQRALGLQRLFAQPAEEGAPVLLALMAAGDFMANTPVEFLLEGANIRVDFFYIDTDTDLRAAAPPHDAAFVAVAESSANQPLLAHIARVSQNWPRPLLNAPDKIARLTRDGAWSLLGDIEGAIYPRNRLVSRADLAGDGSGEPFPFIVRPLDSHAGEGLEKIDHEAALAAYLAAHAEPQFCVAPFVDYRGPDGLFRKMRIALVDGAPFPVHLAISPRWMIHYLNADMTESAAHRAEEARFFAEFALFARRHEKALAQLREKAALDYFLIDCAETQDGKLLIFEVGAAMIAHDLDCPQTFPYKSAPMRRLFEAFQRLILSRAAGDSLRQG